METNETIEHGWKSRFRGLGEVALRCAAAYGEMVVTTRFNQEIYGNRDPIDIEVEEFAACLPKYYRRTDWE